MRSLLAFLIVATLLPGVSEAESEIPGAGLAAEGAGRWAEALQIYREAVLASGSAGLWLRIADIEARLGRPDEAVAALERAAAAEPRRPDILARLSRAYASRGEATLALRAIEVALALEPASHEHLRAHAVLATWAGQYADAARTYQTLQRKFPADADLSLGLARVLAWSGDSDGAVAAYRSYLLSGGETAAALELAKAEAWRGNVAGAVKVLDEYAARPDATGGVAGQRAGILARGGRPREALDALAPLLAASPDSPDLILSRTVALAASGRRGAAKASLADARSQWPERPDVEGTARLVRSLGGSRLGPAVTVYSDSDGLRRVRTAPTADIAFASDTRLHGGYEHLALTARVGSGLDSDAADGAAQMDHLWAGLSQRVGALTLGGTVGRAGSSVRQRITYAGTATFRPADSFSAAVSYGSGLAGMSPRTLALGLERDAYDLTLEWTPGLQSRVGLAGSYELLSDGNSRWDLQLAPATAVVRRQHLNLDLGLLLQQFGAARDLANGYYDPRRHEYYAVVASPYWKISDDVGIGVSAGIGGQRENFTGGFRLGTNLSVEGTLGIYRSWLLRVNAGRTNNRRLDSGAFSGRAVGVELVRRFS